MPFIALGVEHRSCPLSIREAVALDPEGVEQVSRALRQHDHIDEVTILSTCNRTEIYLYATEISAAAAIAGAILVEREPLVTPYVRTWDDLEAVEHLFRVACGLESQALGEYQILGQVREALERAEQAQSIGPNLHALFRAAIACARQARAGTALGRINVSLASEAVRAAESALGSLQGRPVLVIGSGEISRTVAEELRARGVGRLYVANRTESVAVDLARQHGGRAARLDDLPCLAPHVDLIVSATSAPGYVLLAEHLIGRDSHRPLHIYDLAIPRDVDPAIEGLPGVVLRDLDSLLPSGLAEQWTDDVRAMETVVAAEVKEFTVWYQTRRVAPVIASLRAHVEAVSAQELKRVAPRLKDLDEREWAAVESMTERLIDKMFHHLVTRLRLAAQADPKLVDAAEFFFLHGEGGLFEHALQREREKPEEVTKREL